MSVLDLHNPKDLFETIQPEVDAAFNRHVSTSRRDTISLDPYTLVPLANYDALRTGYEDHVAEWARQGIDIRPIVIATLLVDCATETNLPWYTATNESALEAMHEWNGRWTAEESSHGEIMVRDIEARGILDMSKQWLPVREQNMATGIHVKIGTPAEAIAYVTTQELLTKVAHFQSARIMDSAGGKTLRQLGGDEGRHYRFYLSCLAAIARVAPDIALAAMRKQHEGKAFAMPGQKGIIDYDRLATIIALSGIFDSVTVLEAQKQTIDEAGLLEVKPTTDQGKMDQQWAQGISSKEDPKWRHTQRAMDIIRRRAAREIKPGSLKPFILGHTVKLEGNLYVAA